MTTKPLDIDPIAEARRHWAERWGQEPARPMAAITSIMRAQQILLARYNEMLGPLALTFPRYEALMLLSFTRGGTLPLGKIAERLQVHRTSVTNIIDKLEADGLVRRVPHGADRPAVTGTGDLRATSPVDVVHPLHLLRIGLDVRQLEVDHYGLLPASHDHARQRRLRARVDLLVWHVRRDEDEVAGAGLGDKFKPVTPAHAGPAARDIDDALDGAVVVGAGLRGGVDDDGAGPQLLCAGARRRDRGRATHPGRLGRVRVQLVAVHDTYAVQVPVVLGVLGGHAVQYARTARRVMATRTEACPPAPRRRRPAARELARRPG